MGRCPDASGNAVDGDRIRLDRLVEGLEPGRVVAITGRWPEWDDDVHPDPEEATGLPVAELATILDVLHDSPPNGRVRPSRQRWYSQVS